MGCIVLGCLLSLGQPLPLHHNLLLVLQMLIEPSGTWELILFYLTEMRISNCEEIWKVFRE